MREPRPRRKWRPWTAIALAAAAVTVLADSPRQVPRGWWAEVRSEIEQSEYRVTWQPRTVLEGVASAWQAPNRAQGFRTYFLEDGIQVVSRSHETEEWRLGLSLIGYGREGQVRSVAQAGLVPAGERIEYRRARIAEWYVNEPRGLKQGFTLEIPPESASGDRPVRIDLELSGSLSPVAAAEDRSLHLVTPDGRRVLRYSGLVVFDATGRELDARLEGFAENGTRGIRIVVDDRGAVFPLTVDPLLTSADWTAEGNQQSAELGWSVSTAGDVNGDGYADVIVGAWLYDNGEPFEGRAYTFHGSAAGLAATPSWTAESNQDNTYFGRTVATAGDVNGDGYADVVVGAFNFDDGEVDEGRAYCFHGSSSGLSGTPSWIANGDQTGAQLGYAVAPAGDVNGDGYGDVIVGANWYDSQATNEGRVLVYHGSPAGLSTVEDWTRDGSQSGGELGYSVATAGDVNGDGYADVIVGALRYENVELQEGRALVFHGSPGGLASAPDWTSEGDQPLAFLGRSVSGAGDVNGDGYSDVVVGAYAYSNGQDAEGRVFVHHGSATGLSTLADWTAESDQAQAHFGFSVATAGDVNGDGYADIIAGAWRYDGGDVDEGRALVYQGSVSGLSSMPDWTAEADQFDAGFGYSVHTAGDVDGDGYSDVIVGASYYDNGEPDEGRAYVYHGSPDGLSQGEGWRTEGEHDGAQYGFDLASAGDVNGDGYSDVIVGAPGFDNGEVGEGRAFVFHGTSTGLPVIADWTAEGQQAGAAYGRSVASAGDVNGDGYDDVIAGAPGYDEGEPDEGRTFVYIGSPTGLSMTADWTAEANQPGALFGSSVATAGDVNGDGHSDVIVGAPDFDNGEPEEGRSYVFHGSAAGLLAGASWTAESDQAGAHLGGSVATAGDVNADGYADVIVGAYAFDNGQTDEGRAFLFHGSAAGLAPNAQWIAENDQAGSELGRSVASAGDVDGDGYADVVVSAPRLGSLLHEGAGGVYVFHGSTGGVSGQADWTAVGDQADAGLGDVVACAGDVNGDGYADLIVGSPSHDLTETDEGRTELYTGSAAGLVTSPSRTIEGDGTGDRLGGAVAAAGDVNGDGYADVLIGARASGDGQARLYYGNGGAGLSLRPVQRRDDDAGPIAHLGASDSTNAFRLGILGRSPFGRGRVKLEWEIKRLRKLFDGQVTERSASWTDTGTEGAVLSERIDGLVANQLYHWRVRLLYDPVTTPYQQASRWMTIPHDGWQEPDLRTATTTAGAVPDGSSVSGAAMTVGILHGPTDQLVLSWDSSCDPGDTDYEIYEGPLGDFDSHAPASCSTGGATSTTFTPAQGSTYYLVVPSNGAREGSYGRDSAGRERPPAIGSCLLQAAGECR